MILATSTFLQVIFAAMLVVPVIILWVAAVIDALRGGGSGWRLAGVLVLILVLPLLGPLLYFVFRAPRASDASPEELYMADADRRREAAGRPVGGSGMTR